MHPACSPTLIHFLSRLSLTSFFFLFHFSVFFGLSFYLFILQSALSLSRSVLLYLFSSLYFDRIMLLVLHSSFLPLFQRFPISTLLSLSLFLVFFYSIHCFDVWWAVCNDLFFSCSAFFTCTTPFPQVATLPM